MLVGSRIGGHMRTETPVPVDAINVNQAEQNTAKTDLTSLLNIAGRLSIITSKAAEMAAML